MAESLSSSRIFFSATRLPTPLTRSPTMVAIWALLQDTKNTRVQWQAAGDRHPHSQREGGLTCAVGASSRISM